MNLSKIHHIAIIVSDYEAAKDFYVNKLGFYIVRIFTNDVQMINLVTKLLAIDVVLELGRGQTE